jgi:peroxiredoxin
MRSLFAGIVLVALASHAAAAEPATKPIPDFTLRDYRGKAWSLNDFRDKKLVVVAFLGTECPLAKLYAPPLARLAADYGPRGVAVVGIDANAQDGVTQIGAFARQNNLDFPLLKDLNNRVADLFGAERTPEVFVLDGERIVRYRGRIDDRYGIGYARDKATRPDLATALDELLAGKPVSVPVTAAIGCKIGRARSPQADSPVTFAKDIAPLFNRRCVECHRAGEIAPFSLTTYKQAAGWADMILEVIEDGRMPPWHADPKYSHFANDRRLTDAEKKLIRDWVARGAPEGDPKDLPLALTFTDGWQLPKPPDKVVAMDTRPYKVPAEGTVRYQYFAADPGFTEDKWLQAVEVRPGSRAVVHHILVFAVTGMNRNLPDEGGRQGFLAGFVPGLRPLPFPRGYAKRVPANSKLLFQVHYTPNGTEQTDLSHIGFVFADPATVTHEVKTTSAVARRLAIPPGDADHVVEATSRPLPAGAQLLGFMPHMHVRGSAFKYEAKYPDGKAEVLLDVPHYDFNWQTSYRLAERRAVPAGTAIHATAHYDNSAANPNNPDPTKLVRWGDQTWNEMMIGYFDMAVLRGTKPEAAAVEKPTIPPGGVVIPERFLPLLRRYDKNGDGKLSADEIDALPPALKERVLEYIRQLNP